MEDNQEIWKDIKGYEGLYQVSNLGRVKSLERTIERVGKTGNFILKEKILNSCLNKQTGDYIVNLSKNGKHKNFKVHELVFLNFSPACNNKRIFHKDKNKQNNHINNLFVILPSKLDNEIFKDIEGFEGYYQISNLGRVKSVERIIDNNGGNQVVKERVLKVGVNSSGYYVAAFSKDCRSYSYQLHRLVAQYFIPNPENKPEVNHIDGNKLNNKIENLEWCDRSRNAKHAYEIGLNKGPDAYGNALKGEKNPYSKLTEEQVREIRGRKYVKGFLAKTAKEFNVSRATILEIIKRNTWKHI